jgi:hypothetical protein
MALRSPEAVRAVLPPSFAAVVAASNVSAASVAAAVHASSPPPPTTTMQHHSFSLPISAPIFASSFSSPVRADLSALHPPPPPSSVSAAAGAGGGGFLSRSRSGSAAFLPPLAPASHPATPAQALTASLADFELDEGPVMAPSFVTMAAAGVGAGMGPTSSAYQPHMSPLSPLSPLSPRQQLPDSSRERAEVDAAAAVAAVALLGFKLAPGAAAAVSSHSALPHSFLPTLKSTAVGPVVPPPQQLFATAAVSAFNEVEIGTGVLLTGNLQLSGGGAVYGGGALHKSFNMRPGTMLSHARNVAPAAAQEFDADECPPDTDSFADFADQVHARAFLAGSYGASASGVGHHVAATATTAMTNGKKFAQSSHCPVAAAAESLGLEVRSPRSTAMAATAAVGEGGVSSFEIRSPRPAPMPVPHIDPHVYLRARAYTAHDLPPLSGGGGGGAGFGSDGLSRRVGSPLSMLEGLASPSSVLSARSDYTTDTERSAREVYVPPPAPGGRPFGGAVGTGAAARSSAAARAASPSLSFALEGGIMSDQPPLQHHHSPSTSGVTSTTASTVVSSRIMIGAPEETLSGLASLVTSPRHFLTSLSGHSTSSGFDSGHSQVHMQQMVAGMEPPPSLSGASALPIAIPLARPRAMHVQTRPAQQQLLPSVSASRQQLQQPSHDGMAHVYHGSGSAVDAFPASVSSYVAPLSPLSVEGEQVALPGHHRAHQHSHHLSPQQQHHQRHFSSASTASLHGSSGAASLVGSPSENYYHSGPAPAVLAAISAATVAAHLPKHAAGGGGGSFSSAMVSPTSTSTAAAAAAATASAATAAARAVSPTRFIGGGQSSARAVDPAAAAEARAKSPVPRATPRSNIMPATPSVFTF